MKEIENINVLDYKIEIEKVTDDEGGGYIATIPELGCIGDGNTIEEAINDVIEVAENLIKIAKEDGKEIPIPQRYKIKEEYSGKLTLRIPKTLHKMLSLQAEKEGCSINQLITTYISLGIGNEFGKSQVSISIDASPYIVERLIKDQWEKYNNIGKNNKRIDLLALNDFDSVRDRNF
ncbi:toxin-antitoxin system HicB family antitoxin [Thermovenabulum sp.]|uniref:toxin-antitoxin system HicB family antitoxin n=1 Tax=Thermovenabulum sp. TaxID=3100335 RepID=UPI003C7BEF12